MKHILVTGSHRSGTTWMGNMISLADNVHYISEIFNPERDPGRCQVSFSKWFTYIPVDKGDVYYKPLKESIVDHRYYLIRGLRSSKTPGGIKASLLEYWGNQRAARNPELRSLLKDPIALFSAEWLSKKFDMDVVVMVRHPAGFTSSLIKHGYKFPFQDLFGQKELMDRYLADFSDQISNPPETSLDQAILLWRIFYSVIRIYQEEHPSWLFVRYEDLAADPIINFEEIYNSLNLEWTPTTKKQIQSYSSSDNPVESSESMDIRRDSKGMAQQWKKRLTLAEIEKIKDETGDIWPDYYLGQDW